MVVIPGERELEALAEGSYRALKGDIPILEFIPQKDLLIKVKWKFQNIEFEKKGIRN